MISGMGGIASATFMVHLFSSNDCDAKSFYTALVSLVTVYVLRQHHRTQCNSRLGFKTWHQAVEGLYVMEGAAAALVVVALKFGEVKVLIQRLQLSQSLLQRFRRVGEPGEVAEPIGIDHIGHFHQVCARSRKLCARIIEIPGEKHRVAARVTVVGRRRIRRIVCVADAAV